jgi:NTP pyrophosphatase (non-canonical NTP hydrolase)
MSERKPVTQQEIHQLALDKGWWEPEQRDGMSTNAVLAKLALIHSEVSEAVEEVRVTPVEQLVAVHYSDLGKPEGFAVELADVVIRALDLAAALGINLDEVIREKHTYNAMRSHRHGGKLA